VSGIRKHSIALHGTCVAGQDHTFTVPVTAGPKTTTTVLANRALYSNGSGCGLGSTTCSGVCTFREMFTVVTARGDVPAGNFRYEIVLGDCERCLRDPRQRTVPPGSAPEIGPFASILQPGSRRSCPIAGARLAPWIHAHPSTRYRSLMARAQLYP
jgi:hypothetical protein